ncbi:2Fe-2S iron-sulfur cluster binding domain-containing protein [Thalassovita sp.]|uniref:2Fe-2S iron-sulfur cluster binding domain-containing protein n=1 Tax=Thalassovita sp. TaxID=1979401 RepID=UPI003B5A0D97
MLQGLEQRRIAKEETHMADGSGLATVSIRIKGDARSVSCGTSEKLLTAIEREFLNPRQRPVRVGCRQGGCGACRIKVTEGQYATEKMSRDHVTEEEETQGFALACRVYPQTDLEIEPAFRGPVKDRSGQDT